jgi:hypothetical protein
VSNAARTFLRLGFEPTPRPPPALAAWRRPPRRVEPDRIRRYERAQRQHDSARRRGADPRPAAPMSHLQCDRSSRRGVSQRRVDTSESHSRSNTAAMPWPPPMHMVTSA